MDDIYFTTLGVTYTANLNKWNNYMTRVLNYFKKINKFSKSKRNDAALEKLTIVRSLLSSKFTPLFISLRKFGFNEWKKI